VGLALQHGTAFDRFYEALAFKPWCGDDKSAMLVRPKNLAVKKAYIAPNPPSHVHWLVFDLDHTDYFVWHEASLPEPNIAVQNPSNGYTHLYYAISPVCITDNARKGPIRYMEAVARGMTKALGADPSYTGRIAKNPMSPAWRVTEFHTHQYDLDELANEVEPISKPFISSYEEDMPEGRNCALFHELRHWAYTEVAQFRNQSSENKWHDAVLNQALSLVRIEADFTYNEVKNTAKSVAKWTWAHYTGNGINRGVMDLQNSDLPLKARQRLASRRTHLIRSSASEERVKKAIETLTKDKCLPSKAAVAALAGISRQQVTRRYAHLFVLTNTIKKRGGSNLNHFVTYGVHQITAGLLGGNTDEDTLGGIEKQDEGD